MSGMRDRGAHPIARSRGIAVALCSALAVRVAVAASVAGCGFAASAQSLPNAADAAGLERRVDSLDGRLLRVHARASARTAAGRGLAAP